MTPNEAAENPALILIVDDERDNRELLQIILDHEGFRTVLAASGADALAAVAERRPALILLDAMMPDMDGYELAATFKRDPATKDIPIIIITGMEDSVATGLAAKAGADESLPKPVNRAVLLVRVRHLLRGKNDGAV